MIPIIAPVVSIFRRFGRAIRIGWSQPEFRGLLYSVVVIVALGTVFYRTAEGWGWVDSLFFTVVTLTTVGYGDLSPSGPVSKVFTMVFIMLGIGLLFSFIERIARYAAEDAASRRQRRRGSTDHG
jgi:voltage-gated potassium channel